MEAFVAQGICFAQGINAFFLHAPSVIVPNNAWTLYTLQIKQPTGNIDASPHDGLPDAHDV
eukprot:scaffold33219_cov20-Tisochrysis_lutea.AAC.1